MEKKVTPMGASPVGWYEERDGLRSLRGYDGPLRGACGRCRHCSRDYLGEVPEGSLRDELSRGWGLCTECPDEAALVPLDAEHGWDECFEAWDA